MDFAAWGLLVEEVALELIRKPILKIGEDKLTFRRIPGLFPMQELRFRRLADSTTPRRFVSSNLLVVLSLVRYQQFLLNKKGQF